MALRPGGGGVGGAYRRVWVIIGQRRSEGKVLRALRTALRFNV